MLTIKNLNIYKINSNSRSNTFILYISSWLTWNRIPWYLFVEYIFNSSSITRVEGEKHELLERGGGKHDFFMLNIHPCLKASNIGWFCPLTHFMFINGFEKTRKNPKKARKNPLGCFFFKTHEMANPAVNWTQSNFNLLFQPLFLRFHLTW